MGEILIHILIAQAEKLQSIAGPSRQGRGTMRHSRPENICIKLHRASPGFHRNPQLVFDRRKKMCVAIILLLGLCCAGSDWLKRCSTATLLILCESVRQLVYKLDAHTHIHSNPVHFHLCILPSNLLLNKREAEAVQLRIKGASSISNHLTNDTA